MCLITLHHRHAVRSPAEWRYNKRVALTFYGLCLCRRWTKLNWTLRAHLLAHLQLIKIWQWLTNSVFQIAKNIYFRPVIFGQYDMTDLYFVSWKKSSQLHCCSCEDMFKYHILLYPEHGAELWIQSLEKNIVGKLSKTEEKFRQILWLRLFRSEMRVKRHYRNLCKF